MTFIPEVDSYRITLTDSKQKAHKVMRQEHATACRRGHKIKTELLRCVSDTRGLSFGVLAERIS